MAGELMGPHGGYRNLKAYQLAEVIFDGTMSFTRMHVDSRSRTVDQMVQAARSGKQNIAEASRASATSKKTELKLVNVARASLEELLLDYEDFLRTNGLELWEKDHEKARFIRKIRHHASAPYAAYRTYVEDKGAANAANTLVVVIHQANFLLDQLLKQLESAFLQEGGFTEKLYHARKNVRSSGKSDRSVGSD